METGSAWWRELSLNRQLFLSFRVPKHKGDSRRAYLLSPKPLWSGPLQTPAQPGCVKCLPQQGQHTLRNLIGLRHHGGTGLLQNLCATERRSFLCKVGVLNAATGSRHVLGRHLQVGYRGFKARLQGTQFGALLELFGDNSTAQTVSFSLSATSGADALSAAVQAINDQSSKTGITAELNSDNSGLILTNTSGNNVVVGKGAAANAGATTVQKLTANTSGALSTAGTAQSVGAATGGSYVTTSGYLTLDSDKSFSVDATTTDTIADANSTLKKVSELDVSTVTKATDALKTIDSALQFISSERAKLGALQSRFEAAISSLNISSENMSAARSRIQDADFAMETANLSRAQILQQAGTAMVAQANQIPQGVLQLLQG
jgi:hypothetical protein